MAVVVIVVVVVAVATAVAVVAVAVAVAVVVVVTCLSKMFLPASLPPPYPSPFHPQTSLVLILLTTVTHHFNWFEVK